MPFPFAQQSIKVYRSRERRRRGKGAYHDDAERHCKQLFHDFHSEAPPSNFCFRFMRRLLFGATITRGNCQVSDLLDSPLFCAENSYTQNYCNINQR
jgi:hypothetical protein